MTPRPARLLPSESDVLTMETEGLDYRNDGDGTTYHRWAVIGHPVGIVYASAMPMPWGVYFAGAREPSSMVWCVRLHTAMTLLSLIVRIA